MKMHFTIVINGEDSIEKKFQKLVEEDPNIHMHLIRSFGQAIMLALRLKDDDNMMVESFRVGKLEEPAAPVPQESDKKVDALT